MLNKMSHAGGVESAEEILFSTQFGYLFPELAASASAKLPVQTATIRGLLTLGNAMADPGEPGFREDLNSNIPSVFTYLGQFIDHDITARTDREGAVTEIAGTDSNAAEFTPVSPETVVKKLKNGRRPQLDLDSLYGDGPRLLGAGVAGAHTQAQCLYDPNTLLLKVQEECSGQVDLPRVGRKAQIADMRNDENVIVSQLHAAFLKFHNAVAQALPISSANEEYQYIKARQLVRWAYQYVVVNDYLKAVCAHTIVDDILLNGPRFYRPGFNDGELFMPLEFSVAGFRFGHSMIRPFYQLNSSTQEIVMNLLGVSRERSAEEQSAGKVDLIESISGGYRLKPKFSVNWSNFAAFAPGQQPSNLARVIDPRIARGLFDLRLDGAPANSMLSHLAQRNLLRGYSLSIPTGQAIAKALGFEPLDEKVLVADEQDVTLRKAIEEGGFGNRTPLWYYVLKEAEVQTQGNSLGAVGSSLVAETLIGLVKLDPNSYLNNAQHPAVKYGGVEVMPGQVVSTMADILKIAQVTIS